MFSAIDAALQWQRELEHHALPFSAVVQRSAVRGEIAGSARVPVAVELARCAEARKANG